MKYGQFLATMRGFEEYRAHRFCNDELVILDGRLVPIWAFLTSVSVASVLATENRLSGTEVIAVDSR